MIWSDCPKLNYGTSIKECSPYLLEHIAKYVQDMASIFNGFRLDNAHSTPLFIGEYLAQKAREVNPDLIIMAELFTDKNKVTSFVNRIGINILIQEQIWAWNENDISERVYKYGGGFDNMLGKMDKNKFEYSKKMEIRN